MPSDRNRMTCEICGAPCRGKTCAACRDTRDDFVYKVQCEVCKETIAPNQTPMVAAKCCYCWNVAEERVYWRSWWTQELLAFVKAINSGGRKHFQKSRETIARCESVIRKHKNIHSVLRMVGVLYDRRLYSDAPEHYNWWRDEVRPQVHSLLMEIRRDDIERITGGHHH